MRPQPRELPYYLHTPNGPQEPAPGWYMVPGGKLKVPIYLGASAFDAEVNLEKMETMNRTAKKAGPRTRGPAA